MSRQARAVGLDGLPLPALRRILRGEHVGVGTLRERREREHGADCRAQCHRHLDAGQGHPRRRCNTVRRIKL
jgi:hypothetical protein